MSNRFSLPPRSTRSRAPRAERRTPCRVALLAVGLALAAGCGKKARPLPPEPRGPLAPEQVRVSQVGANARISFIVPRPRGESSAQQLIGAELVRVAYAPGRDTTPDADAFRRRGEIVARSLAEPLPSGARLTLIDEGLGALPGGGTGWTLRYAVRVRDRRTRPSPLVVARDLLPLVPQAAPADLDAEPTADGMRLVWRPPPGGSDLRYNVYRRESSRPWPESPLNAEPIETTEYLDGDVRAGLRYAYQVRVALAPGTPAREGEPSATLETLAEDRLPPAPPTGLVAVQEGLGVRLFWDPGRERDLGGYRVSRSIDGGEFEAIGPGVLDQPTFLDTVVRLGQHLAYRVTAIDRSVPPNESEPTNPVELILVQEPVAGRGAPE